MRTEIQPQTSIGCTRSTLEKIIKFKPKYNVCKGLDLVNYEITAIVIYAGIKSLEESCGISPDKVNACEDG